MRTLLTATAVIASLLTAPAACAADLTVTLADIRATTGTISIAVVDSLDAWNGQARPVHGTALQPDGDTGQVTFKDLKPGTYAVMVTHDENGNGTLDTNKLGMPLEGYGFSNNPQVMRKPTFDEAKFEVGEAAHGLTVELR